MSESKFWSLPHKHNPRVTNAVARTSYRLMFLAHTNTVEERREAWKNYLVMMNDHAEYEREAFRQRGIDLAFGVQDEEYAP